MVFTRGQVRAWESSAKPGAHLSYHKGISLSRTSVVTDPVVNAVRELYNEGKVDLVQRRLSKGTGSLFEYIAIKRERVSPPKPAFAKCGTRVDRFPIPA